MSSHLCLKPGCGRPTWDGQPGGYCSGSCRDSAWPAPLLSHLGEKPGCGKPTPQTVQGLPGLYFIPDFISPAEQAAVLADVLNGPWTDDRSKKRKVQMFGPWRTERYTIDPTKPGTPHPQYSAGLAARIAKEMKKLPEDGGMKAEDFASFLKVGSDTECQLIINQYFPSDELDFHFDNPKAYGPVIAGLSLEGDGIISFRSRGRSVDVALPPRSLYLMTGDSRYKWRHGMVEGKACTSDRRISLTWRNQLKDREGAEDVEKRGSLNIDEPPMDSAH